MKYKYVAVLGPVKNSESYYAHGPNLPLSEKYYNHNDGEWIDRNHIFCPVAQRILEIIDCMEINDVARRIQIPRVLESFSPPIPWNEDQRKICENCKFYDM